MAVILVVERDPNDAQIISDALRSEGWSVEVANGADAALRSASADAPRLVLVAAGLADTNEIVTAFARRRGGPGVIVLRGSGEMMPTDADAWLQRPVFVDELRETVRDQLRATSLPGQESRAERTASSKPLTSADIFADVLAEVEAEVGWPPAHGAQKSPAAVPPSRPPLQPQPQPQLPPLQPQPPPQPPPKPPAPAPQPAARSVSQSTDDIERQLEKTLSGVLDLGGVRRRPPSTAAQTPPAPSPAAPGPAAPAPSPSSDIDDLLDKTLSSLVMPARARKPVPPPAPAGTSGAAPTTAPEPPPPAPEPVLTFPELPPLAPEPPSPAPELLSALPALDAATPAPAPPRTPVREEPPALALDLSPFEIPELDQVRDSPFPDLPELSPAPPAPTAPEPAFEMAEVGSAFHTQKMPALDALLARTETPASSETGGEVLGEYTLLERIAIGGMAEVWKARRRGVEGFQKTVAIKRILSHLTATPDFVKMFIDEANLAAQLNHDNIIQIYHLGKEGGDLFIAMEFVEGMDLRTMQAAARQQGRSLPAGLALLVAARVARALDYAHRKRDFDHRALGLVHRDVSPQNVLISYEGEIKLCDFGIVKAVAKASTTQMGALKGKLQYMSPEQAWGKPVDARSDIFSLGSVLYEMLTGRKLFAADSEVGVLDAVRECVVPPLGELDPSLPPGKVERILHKALAKRPEDRYQTAGELEQELESLLFSLKPTPSLSELAAFMKRLVERPAFGEPAASPKPAAPETEPGLPSRPALTEPPETTSPVAVAPPAKKPSNARMVVLLVVLAALAAIAIYVFLLIKTPEREHQPAAGETPAATEAAPPAPTEGEADGSESGGAIPENLEEMVKERLDAREDSIRRSLEAKKRRLEEELRRAQEANQELEKATQPADAAVPSPDEPPPAPKPDGGGTSEP